MSHDVMQQALKALRTCSWSRETEDAITALSEELAKPEPEPFGYFKAEPFGWTDCAETDEGAKALYEALPQCQPLTDEEIDRLALNYSLPYLTRCFVRAIEAKLKGQA